jgi:hypothetical protein
MEDDWKEMYIKMKRRLSVLQVEILQCGPKSLLQAYELVKMREDYDRIMKEGEI